MAEQRLTEQQLANAAEGLLRRLSANHKRAVEVIGRICTYEGFELADSLIARQRSPWDKLALQMQELANSLERLEAQAND